LSSQLDFNPDSLSLAFTFGKVRINWENFKPATIHGRVENPLLYPHHEASFVRSEFGSGVIELKMGGEKGRISLKDKIARIKK
jgi:hypothetical protein